MPSLVVEPACAGPQSNGNDGRILEAEAQQSRRSYLGCGRAWLLPRRRPERSAYWLWRFIRAAHHRPQSRERGARSPHQILHRPSPRERRQAGPKAARAACAVTLDLGAPSGFVPTAHGFLSPTGCVFSAYSLPLQGAVRLGSAVVLRTNRMKRSRNGRAPADEEAHRSKPAMSRRPNDAVVASLVPRLVHEHSGSCGAGKHSCRDVTTSVPRFPCTATAMLVVIADNWCRAGKSADRAWGVPAGARGLIRE
jgi:hypothetical protein